MNDEKKVLALLGIAKKAGKVISGTDMVTESIRSQSRSSVKLVLLASDASQNTKKRINNTAEYYKVPIISLGTDKAELARLTGHASELSVIGITDDGFASAMQKTKEN